MKPRFHGFWLLLGMATVAAFLHLFTGPYPVDWASLFSISASDAPSRNVFFLLRLPRLAAAVLAGGALGLAGAVTQTSLRNPLASPDLLGVTAGAGVGAFLVIRMGGAFHPGLPLGALAGAIAAAGALWLFGRSGAARERLILAGLGLSSLAGALTSLLLILAREVEVRQFLFWTLGGLELRGWMPLALALPLAAGGIVLLAGQMGNLDSFHLGDDPARLMGINVGRVRLRVLTSAVLLSSAAVTLAGPLPFLGLLGPHLARFLSGSGSRSLLPASAITGSLFLTGADALAKAPIFPFELRTGVLLALVGAPAFLTLLARRSRG